MSGPFGSSQFMYATGAAEEGQSLRFEDGDSAYLSWTPASAGNRKTWTWSGWVKRGNLDTAQILFSVYTDTSNLAYLSLEASNKLIFLDKVGNVTYYKRLALVLRDPSAWFHLHFVSDTTDATASNRYRFWINGVEQTQLTNSSNPPLNRDGYVNTAVTHNIARYPTGLSYFDGYLANVCFIDGQALDPTSFGEYQDTLWKPKSDADIQSLTFGTNGFYLPFKQTTEAEGFSTVTYTGNGGTQGIEGVGFEPDLVWIKARNFAGHHVLVDSVRGTFSANRYGRLFSNTTGAEDVSSSDTVTSLDAGGFGVNSAGSGSYVNDAGDNYVAWCWDAGSGSPVSNTDGSVTSSVKANTAKGFSIVTHPNGSGTRTVGHGLNSAPELIIEKKIDATGDWIVATTVVDGSYDFLRLNTTAAKADAAVSAPTATVYSPNVGGGADCLAYCFHSVSGYSSFGSYTGDGTSNGSKSINLGFKPAFVMIKRTNATENWMMLDTTRNPYGIINNNLYANLSNAESDYDRIEATATGFDIYSNFNDINASGSTYIYLAFADTRDATFFGDTSGNGNNWTPNKLNNTDVVLDSPVTGGNFAVLDILGSGAGTWSEGNLKYVSTADTSTSTFGLSSGAFYAEILVSASSNSFIGVCDISKGLNPNRAGSWSSHGGIAYKGNGDQYSLAVGGSSSTAAYGSSYTAGDIIGIAVDIDADTITFYKNGVSQGTTTNGVSYISSDGVYGILVYGTSSTFIANFGQDSSFAGNETPQGNTDDNGVGDFYYAPPSGFLALTTGNLPAATITAPDEYFNTVLYSGDGTSSRSITGVGFQPDWVWIKIRNGLSGNNVFDSVRGATKRLYTNGTAAEDTLSGVTSFDTDGFTLGSALNGSSESNVAWNWLAGNGTVSNTDGSITSTVSSNPAAGFSVVSYTGTGSAATVGHGLSSAPDLIIVKNRDTARNWTVYNSASGATKYLLLNTTNADQTGTSIWNDTAPTSSVFSVGTSQNVNYAEDYIAYCFHSVEGYSKIGSYTGNGSSDGTFVHCGFRPAFIMIKCTSGTSNWLIRDVKRDTYNQSVTPLAPNLSAAESSFSPTLNETDILSNGFKLRDNYGDQNGSGQTYIFIAFASAPFKSANAR